MRLNSILKTYEPADINSYFKHCGISDVREYLKPKGKYNCNPFGFAHIRDGINLYKYHVLNDDIIGILVDSDVDGYTSSSIVYRYTKNVNKNVKIKLYIHEGKDRGLSDDKVYNKILKDKPNLLIIPDAGSEKTNREQVLLDNNIDLLVLDHHVSDNYIDCGVLINNQLEENIQINKNLSGCGVTYKFFKAMDIELGVRFADNFMDLVGLSVLSDSMPLNDYENRYYVYGLLTLDNLKNPFLYELLDQYTKGIDLTIKDISWFVIPKINSVIRSDDMEVKQKVLGAMCRLKGSEYVSIAEECGKYHRMQYDYVTDFVDRNMDDALIGKNVIILLSKEIKRSYSGLVAGNISGKNNHKPTIVGKIGKSGEAIGSFRGDYIDRLTIQNVDGVNWAKGHPDKSFGISIDGTKVDDIFNNINALDIDFTLDVDVLQTYPINSVPKSLFGEFKRLNGIIGEGLVTTDFGITDIRVNPREDIKILKNNTVKVTSHGIDIMFFRVSDDDLKNNFHIIVDEDGKINYTSNEMLNITVVGQLNKNIWKGRVTNQVIVSQHNYEITTDMDYFN